MNLEEEIRKNKEQDDVNLITFIPKNIIPNYKPDAYDKKLDGINDINSAYSSSIPSIHITDSVFADNQLNNLYGTPQYKNINTMDIDSSLKNYNEKQTHFVTGLPKNTSSSPNESQETNINLFRNPKKDFLDNNWLYLKENTYNDNCKDCKTQNTNTNTNSNKNAICSVVKYGQELSECTNQKNTINNNQLENISTNLIKPIYKL